MIRCIAMSLVIASCGGPQTGSVTSAGMLEQLHEEGWIDAMRNGQCEADGEHSDPSQECLDAVRRFDEVKADYAQESMAERREIHRTVAALAPTGEGTLDCPVDDEGIFGAQLAVARHLRMWDLDGGVPFVHTERDCTLGSLGGPVEVQSADPEPGPVDPRGVASYAADAIVQTCSTGIAGLPDRCWDAEGNTCVRSCDGDALRCCSELEYLSDEPGTISFLVDLSRSGRGSVAQRSYNVRRRDGAWRVQEILRDGH